MRALPNRLLATTPYAALAAVTLACLPSTGSDVDYPEQYHGDVPIRVINVSSHPICSVHIAPSTTTVWGLSWIRSEIGSGMMKVLHVRAGKYNVKLGACSDDRALTQQPSLDLRAPREIVLHDGAPPSTPPPRGFTRMSFRTWRSMMGPPP